MHARRDGGWRRAWILLMNLVKTGCRVFSISCFEFVDKLNCIQTSVLASVLGRDCFTSPLGKVLCVVDTRGPVVSSVCFESLLWVPRVDLVGGQHFQNHHLTSEWPLHELLLRHSGISLGGTIKPDGDHDRLLGTRCSPARAVHPACMPAASIHPARQLGPYLRTTRTSPCRPFGRRRRCCQTGRSRRPRHQPLSPSPRRLR